MNGEELIWRHWDEVKRAEQERRPAILTPEHLAALLRERDDLYAEQARFRSLLAEHERTQATGGPPPPETRGWANEAIVPAPETAHDQSMAVPDRYQRSDAHLRDRREDTT